MVHLLGEQTNLRRWSCTSGRMPLQLQPHKEPCSFAVYDNGTFDEYSSSFDLSTWISLLPTSILSQVRRPCMLTWLYVLHTVLVAINVTLL